MRKQSKATLLSPLATTPTFSLVVKATNTKMTHRRSSFIGNSLAAVVILWLSQLLLLAYPSSVSAYHMCASQDGGGICPDADTSCPTRTPGVSSCISSKKGEPAVCCLDDGVGVTGCPNGYECLSKSHNNSTISSNRNTRRHLRSEHPKKGNSNSMMHNPVLWEEEEEEEKDNEHALLYCHRIDPDYNGSKPKPLVLPRYKLTTLPHKVFTQVYGLPLLRDTPRTDVSRISPADATATVIVDDNDNKKVSTDNEVDDDDDDDIVNNDDDDDDIVNNVAYFSSMGSLDSSNVTDLQNHQRVTTVFVVVHGSGRTAEDYLYGAVSSLPKDQQDPSNATIMVLSPWFLDPADDNDDDDDDNSIPIPLPPNTLRWWDTGPLYHTWRYGADAINSPLSSFAAMDRLVERLVEDPVRFPALSRILVAGHSAGGQFVQRWAMLSNSPVWKEPSEQQQQQQQVDVTDDANNLNERNPFLDAQSQHSPQFKQRNVRIRAIPANPRCFAMLDDRRYVHDATTNSTVFRRPDDGDISECPDFNEWIWGLDAGGSVTAPYKDRAIAIAGGAKALAHRYVAQRNVVYLAGGEDLEVFDDDCGSVIQGKTRRERSRKFMASLHELYPQEMKAQLHTRLVAEGVPHDHTLMFQSPAGQEALFGDNN